MYSKPRAISSILAIGLLGLGVYHLYTVGQLRNNIEENDEQIENLKQKQIDYSVENKALSEELEELESDYLHKLEKIETYEEQMQKLEEDIKNKNNEINKLNEDLQAKKNREAKEARLAKESKKEENDKTTILSSNNTSKPEQKESNKENDSGKTNEKEITTSSTEVKTNNTLGTFEVTYYSAYDGAQVGITRGGTNMANGNIHTSDGYRIIAVDPNTIPFGSIVRVTTSHGESFLAKADDTGGAIQGNIIDIAVSSPEEAMRLGRGTATVELVR